MSHDLDVAQINNFSRYEWGKEYAAAKAVSDAVIALRDALNAADPFSEVGCDAVAGLKDALGDSGVYEWLDACCDAGVLDGGDYTKIFRPLHEQNSRRAA